MFYVRAYFFFLKIVPFFCDLLSNNVLGQFFFFEVSLFVNLRILEFHHTNLIVECRVQSNQEKKLCILYAQTVSQKSIVIFPIRFDGKCSFEWKFEFCFDGNIIKQITRK